MEDIKEKKETAEQMTESVEETVEGVISDATYEEATEEVPEKGRAEESVKEADAPAAEDEPEEVETIGNIKISVEVVSTIAGIAASGIDGVSCMYTTFADGVAKRFGAKKTASSGVKVIMNGGSVNIDLYIVVEYGIRIPELAWSIQESVKDSVENMTGLKVEKVNIHIEGISFPEETKDIEE